MVDKPRSQVNDRIRRAARACKVCFLARSDRVIYPASRGPVGATCADRRDEVGLAEQRELEQRVRSSYELTRAQHSRAVERKTPAAALDALLRSAEVDDGRDADALRVSGLCGAYSPASAGRALALAGRPFACGWLVVTDGVRDLALLFTTSGAKALAAGFSFPRLGQRLLEKGRVRSAELARLGEAVKKHRGEQEALVAIGVAPDVVIDTAAEVVGQVVLDAVFWSTPMFEAAGGEAGAELLDRRDVEVLTLNARAAKALVQHLAERLSELAAVHRAVPSLRVALSEGPRANERSASLSARAVEILTVLSREPGVVAEKLPDQLAAMGYARPTLHGLARDLKELITRGIVVTASAPAEPEPARPPETGLAPLPRRLWLAKLHFDAGDRRASARQLSRAGTQLLAQGRAIDASRCLAAAHGLQADDIEAHDGLVRALLACDRKDDARQEAEGLARRYLDVRLPGRARRVLAPRLQEREETPLLLLQLEALLALGEARALAEAAERTISALLQEGHRREAQELADALADHAADTAGRDRILRAGGMRAGSPVVGRVAIGLMVALALLLLPAIDALRARTAYAGTVSTAASALLADPAAFDAVEALFEPVAAGSGDVALAARRVLARTQEHREDHEALQRLRRAMAAADVEAVLRACADTTPRTESLRAIVAELQRSADERRAEALRATEELTLLVSRGELPAAYACARRLLQEYPDAPGVLRGLALDVRVTSNAGARLRWNRSAFPQPTPFTAKLPLLEDRHVEVSLAGYETVERVLSVRDLAGPDVHIALRPADPRRSPAASDWTGVLVHDGVMREGTAPVRFDQPTRALDGVRVPPRWRARVDAVHEQRQGQLALVALVVTLEELQAGTWHAERPVRIALPTPLGRAVVLRGDGARAVPPIDRTAGLDMAWVREQVQRAVTYVLERGEGGGR